jgi:lipoyl(octanoyl) transferase
MSLPDPNFSNLGGPSVVSRSGRPRLSVWLAGAIDFEDYLKLANRLAWEVSEPDGRGPTLLVCEHAGLITMGRLASRRDVYLTDEQLHREGVRLRFVGRGGGAVPHTSGQAAVALFSRLTDLGLGDHDVAAYVERFEGGLAAAIAAMKCSVRRVSGVPGVFGMSGQLAALGIAVRRGVVSHGGYVNVAPPLELYRKVRTSAEGHMGSIESERRRRTSPAEARSLIVQKLAEAFNAEVVSLQSGIPGDFAAGRPHSPHNARRHVG